MFKQSLMYFSLCLLPLSLSLSTAKKSGSIFIHSHQLFLYIDKVSPEPSPGCPAPVLSASLFVMGAPVSNHLCGFLLGVVQHVCASPPEIQLHHCSCISALLSGKVSPPLACWKCSSWFSSRHCELPLLHFVGLGLIWCPPGPPGLFLPSCLPACCPLVQSDAWGYFFPGVLSTSLCWALWDSHFPVSPQDVLLIYQPLLTLLFHL